MTLQSNPSQLDVVKAVMDLQKKIDSYSFSVSSEYINATRFSIVYNDAAEEFIWVGKNFGVDTLNIGALKPLMLRGTGALAYYDWSTGSDETIPFDKDVAHKTGDEVIAGKKTFQNGGNEALRVNSVNGGSGVAFGVTGFDEVVGVVPAVNIYNGTDEIHTTIKFPTTKGGTFALTSDIPTQTSQLTNDSGFITASALPTKTSDLTNDSGFMTPNTVPSNFQPAPDHLGTPTTPPNNSLWTPTKSGWVMFSCTSHANGAEFYLKLDSSTGLMVGCSLGTGGGSMNYNNCPSMTVPVEAGKTYYVHYSSYSAHYYSS